MRFRKVFFGKLFLLLLCCVFTLWFFRNDVKSPYMKRDPFHKYGVVPSRFSELSEVLTWNSKQCTSTAKRLKVTADFSINDVLDNMKIQKIPYNYVKGELQKNITSFNHEKPSKTEISEPLEIIVIPHSHNDPGWKKTYMKYFLDQTQFILNNIVDKLTQYPDMTFIWVESCFLDVWWRNQTQETKDKFRDLVKSKRLEIVSGMWVAPDEASPHYFQIIDQMIEGHYWVKKNLGVVPESSLNFDQFGYSISIPYLIKKAGLKNVLIKRIHRAIKELMGEKNWMTFKWRQFWDPEGYEDVNGHVDTYEWMAISDSCGPDRSVCRGLDFTMQPDLPIPGSREASRSFNSDYFTGRKVNNLHDFVSQIVQQFKLKASNYRQNVIMLPHGGDFHYAKPEDWDKQYRNMKLFMKYVNDRKKEFNVRMRFGTLRDYYDLVEEKTKTHNLKYPVISGDFFTYTENTEYWTGYFTTRMFDKRLSRELSESLRAAELFSLAVFNRRQMIPEDVKRKMIIDLVTARQNLGVFMHHDAITGTSRFHVVQDYETSLSTSFIKTQDVLSTALAYLLSNDNVSGEIDKAVRSILNRTTYNTPTQRILLNVTGSGTTLFLTNSFTQSRRDIVTLNLDTCDVEILDHQGEPVQFDCLTRDGKIKIMFEVRFPPVGVLTFSIKRVGSNNTERGRTSVKSIPVHGGQFVCENSFVNITFIEDIGSPSTVCYKNENVCSKLEIDWRYYMSHSGAYTMLSSGAEKRAFKKIVTAVPLSGSTFCGVEFAFDFFSVVYKLPMTKGIQGRALRIEVKSDLSMSNDFRGDLAMRLNTGIRSGNTFYVDSNGLQLLRRKYRQTIPFDGNVYPMTSLSVIQDDEMRMLLHSAQPHGVVSSSSGSVDVMIDRVAPRPEMDLPEGALDSKATKVLFLVEFEPRINIESMDESELILPSINSVLLNDLFQHPIYTFFASNKINLAKSVHTFLKQKVPCDVTIANIKNLAMGDFKPDGASLTLFRRGVSCSTVPSESFCPLFDPIDLKPGDLIGQRKSDVMKSKEMFLSHLMEKSNSVSNDAINMSPMDIKTFHLTKQ